MAAAPSLVFVAVNVLASLYPAIIAAAVTAVAGLGYRLARRQSPRSALVGILIVAVCAVVAAVTGEARGFFLVPTLIPFAVILICLATIIARRPLTGLILNRVTGGPPDWYRNPALRRVHLIATSAAHGHQRHQRRRAGDLLRARRHRRARRRPRRHRTDLRHPRRGHDRRRPQDPGGAAMTATGN